MTDVGLLPAKLPSVRDRGREKCRIGPPQTSWADHRQTKIRARLKSTRVLCNRPFKLPHRRAQNIPYEKIIFRP
jgi:hypothetical protein